MTQEEFIDFLRRAEKAVYERIGDNRQRWEELGDWPFPNEERSRFEQAPMPPGGWLGWLPIRSFDNPNIHGGTKAEAIKAALQWDDAEVFQLPVRSSDIHKVIEHTPARLVGAFQRWYYDNLTECPLSEYKRKLEELFYKDPSVASPDVIRADVESLPYTYRQVVEKQGGEISKAYR